MVDSILSLSSVDWQSIIIFIIDKILYVIYFISVSYLLIFSIGSVLNKKKKYAPAKKNHHFAVYFFNNSKSDIVVESVKSFLNQDYPKDKYEIFVVSSDKQTQTNKLLSNLSVKLITTYNEEYSKAKDLQYAISITPDNIYEIALILDAGNTVDLNYLTEINDAFYSGGMAIQTHRVSKDTHTDTALFGAISEEINNSIFRLGHANLGFSSALMGSGTAINFSWLKKNITPIVLVDTVKQLETMLLEQSIFSEYLNYVHVYGDKASKVDEFYEQRKVWYTSPIVKISNIMYKLPASLIQGNYDYCDKLFQWLLPSRMILFGTLIMITFVIFILSWVLAIKWIVLLLILIISFSIATPDHFIDARFIKAMRSAPILILLTIFNALRRKLKIKRTKAISSII